VKTTTPRAARRHYRSPAAGGKENDKNKRLFCSSLRAVTANSSSGVALSG